MPTIYPDETFDYEDEDTPHWSQSNPDHDTKSFLYPAPAGPHRRHAAPRRTDQQTRAADRLAGKPSAMPELTPTQWLAQWCSLDKEK